MNLMQRRPKITITCEAGTRYAGFLRRHLRAALAHLKRSPAAISIVIVTASTIRRLNRKFRGKQKQTDVLAFEISRNARRQVEEGEIAICLDVAVREATRRGHPVENELLLYALHGLLHLCGYDDASAAQAARMHATEDNILRAIGIGAVFAPRRRSPRPSPRVRGVADGSHAS